MKDKTTIEWTIWFGKLIRDARKSLKETQTEFGQRFSVKANTISRYETGQRQAGYEVIFTTLIELNLLKDYGDK